MKFVFNVAGEAVPADISTLVIAGWTGRDRAAVDHHIAELEALGVRPPREVPMFYRVGANLLTTEDAIDVVGNDSSGEVEFVLVSLPSGLHVGVGSDHTDRKVEAYGVTVSKQVCAKPIASELWRFDEVEGHWDQLLLRSFVTRDGVRSLYQEGQIARMLAPRELLARFPDSAGRLPPGTAMFCGTLPVIGPLQGGESFEVELVDPVRGRKLTHRYDARALAIVD
ncbi:MAG TPA: DUF2848 domain-containing protein [Ramlibacter sp.]|nr:DUF2848 domain-containing protein [Ramlibacter sp.]